jgi:hypothetical protein
LVVLTSCEAPAIEVVAIDTGVDARVDAATDTRACDPVKAPDGGVCDPRLDEDLDCTPDACDNCPNVPQAKIAVAKGPDIAGPECTGVGAFESIQRRLIFDGFATRLAAWRDDPSALGESKLTVANGFARFGRAGDGARLIKLDARAGDRNVVVTTRMRFPETAGYAAIALRVPLAPPYSFYGCNVNYPIGSFSLGANTCDAGGTCKPAALAEMPIRKPLPTNVVLEGEFLIRASVITTPTGAKLGCEVFPAPKD